MPGGRRRRLRRGGQGGAAARQRASGGSLGLLIDADVFIALERGEDPRPIQRRLGTEDAAISVVTISELLFGLAFASPRMRASRQAFVEGVLATHEAVPITTDVARVHADLGAHLRKSGTTIGGQDLWLAATAITHSLGVATGNVEEFRRVPGLVVVDALAD